MPNCNFYALQSDCEAIVDFIFSNPGWRLLEASSRPGHPLREFCSTAEVVTAVEFATRFLMLYASEMRGSIRERRIDYTPEAAVELGATHGYSLRGWGLVGLHFSMLRGDVLKYSNTSHNSATRAREWEEIYPEDGAAAAWDWAAVKRISGRLVRFIRKSAASKRGAISVLPSAHEAQSAGRVKFNVEAEKTARGSRI